MCVGDISNTALIYKADKANMEAGRGEGRGKKSCLFLGYQCSVVIVVYSDGGNDIMRYSEAN